MELHWPPNFTIINVPCRLRNGSRGTSEVAVDEIFHRKKSSGVWGGAERRPDVEVTLRGSSGWKRERGRLVCRRRRGPRAGWDRLLAPVHDPGLWVPLGILGTVRRVLSLDIDEVVLLRLQGSVLGSRGRGGRGAEEPDRLAVRAALEGTGSLIPGTRKIGDPSLLDVSVHEVGRERSAREPYARTTKERDLINGGTPGGCVDAKHLLKPSADLCKGVALPIAGELRLCWSRHQQRCSCSNEGRHTYGSPYKHERTCPS